MISKMDSIQANKTSELIELPVQQKTLPCKWVYRYKYVSSSERPKYKAWFVTKGFKQEHAVDYNEIFSFVVKMTTLQLLFKFMAMEDLELEQLDVKTAFLHKDLDEDINMSPLVGFTVMGE